MTLAPGSRIGAFEVTGSLGAGGMGEVYRARDTKLGRDVALKIVPDVFANDPERLARFDREARTLAALNHPHIAHLHGFEESSGIRALVMELVEGEDLSMRLKRGPIALDEALAIAKQIAQALEAAHEQNIIHRDLKPANIKVREDGTVKVLDFGLAKAIQSAGGGSSVTPPAVLDSPTITTPAMTMHGVILGTAAYMAPEQAKGRMVDKRADIWAFGCVLYEMVTGRRAFQGDDVSDTLASVLRAEVDWAGVPPQVERLLKRCLERDPKRRLHDIGDAWDLIDETPADRAPAQPRGLWLTSGLAAVLAIAASTFAWLYFTRAEPVPETVRFQIQPPPKNTFDIYLSISPNGRYLAFTARDEGGIVRLWVRDLQALEARPLTGTEGAWSPFWSPDSRQIAFAVERMLKKIDLAGGPPQTLGESPTTAGTGAWSADGVIVFGTRGQGPLYRIPATGGVPTPLTVVDPARGDGAQSFPQFLPDGRRFLYYRQSQNPEHQGIYAGALDVAPQQQSTTRILATSLGTFFLSTAPDATRILFLREGTLLSQPFDPETLQAQGEARPIVENVGGSGSFGFFSLSATDILVYRTGTSNLSNMQQLTWLDRKGQTVGTVGEARPYALPAMMLALAPDDSQAIVAVAPTLGAADLWSVGFGRGVATRFTFQAGGTGAPIWSPDGARVAFRSSRSGAVDIYVKDVNGTTDESLLVSTPTPETPTDWSRDGRFLLFNNAGPAATVADVWVASPGRDSAPVPLLATRFNEGFGRFSPDGRWISYVSNESGQSEIYLRPFSVDATGKPVVGPKWLVSNAGTAPATGARWRGDGRELFYRAPNGAMMAVDVSSTETKVSTGVPRKLFDLPGAVTNWDVVDNGQRFLVLLSATPMMADPISVVLNWSRGSKP